MPELTSTQRSKRQRLRLFYVRWLPVVLGLTALSNMAAMLFLPLTIQPIRFHEDGSLTHLVHTEQPSVDRRFAFYLELDDATDGGVLIVPIDSFVIPELAEGFADFEVVERAYDPSANAGEIKAPPPLGTVETEDGDLPYSIIPGDDDVWWLSLTDDGIVIVPESESAVPGVGP